MPSNLKRISVADLRIGMHVKEFVGSWIDQPFWRRDFSLDDPRDLRRIRQSRIAEVVIDVARGIDIDANPEMSRGAERHASGGVPIREEIRRAEEICSRAKSAVRDMFSEARLGAAVAEADVRSLVQDISDSVNRSPGALISLARLKNADEYTYMHSVAVSGLMIALGRQMGIQGEELHEVGVAGLMHDIGKAAIPEPILNKPGKLTNEELSIIRSHPESGYVTLRKWGGIPAPALDVCLHHHEKLDGTGYPDRLAGEGISVHARMGAICDVYDALTSNRPYKRGWDPGQTMRRMSEWGDTHLDPHIFQAFARAVGIYPVGTLVRLSSERLAVVSDQRSDALLRPVVTDLDRFWRDGDQRGRLLDLFVWRPEGERRAFGGLRRPRATSVPDLPNATSSRRRTHSGTARPFS